MPRRPLIAQRDIQRAHRDGQRVLAIGNGILTPSARDEASRLGIAIVTDTEAPLAPGSAVLPSASVSGDAASMAAASASGSAARQAPPVASPVRVALGADHGGVEMKDALLAFLRTRGATVQDVGTFGTDAVDYPDYALAVARAVASGAADVGIMVDGAGIGSCMAANKVAGVRAAMCYDVTTASNAREHNHANVLTLGGTLLGTRLAQEIVHTFLETPFGEGRHARRVEKINALDATGGGR